jgi:hypothetical protein
MLKDGGELYRAVACPSHSADPADPRRLQVRLGLELKRASGTLSPRSLQHTYLVAT